MMTMIMMTMIVMMVGAMMMMSMTIIMMIKECRINIAMHCQESFHLMVSSAIEMCF